MAEETLLDRVRASLVPRRQALERVVPDPLDEAKVRAAVSQAAVSHVSATLRQLRAARHLSYDAIRERTGLSQQLLYDVEYRNRRLTLDELRLLAECYGVSADDVLGVNVESQWDGNHISG
ncbi:helix-turn-helix transcriptional regulator [Caldilinea sp.]|uniref:helix-turn-helix domain-containing protein n=1 Tax=Caldilinea sp. TaxID=2293560 RepID=UPI002B9957A7|nr:helix-turn-helix transcriptional regulator [Anaerolineales bacterium]HQY90971.1 helix-turn-helix transcriptional regulator [Caldilinea sp.]HRA64775.1 helix-turn-helix transcriptional regulator [Caldilinea sp.]